MTEAQAVILTQAAELLPLGIAFLAFCIGFLVAAR